MAKTPNNKRSASTRKSKALVSASHRTARRRRTSPPTRLRRREQAGTRKDRLLSQIAKLDLLADCMFKASLETFATADIDADSPHQAAAMKREAASMGKGCASLVMTSERLREIAEKADS